MKRLIIAIDGPAASGKSTTAKLVASRLGYLHVDTGAMYRAMTLKVIQHRIDVKDKKAVAQLASSTRVRLAVKKEKTFVYLDGHDVTESIRTPEVTSRVSAVSSVPEVRSLMVREQRAMGKNGGIVLEGRDIGTVVFPRADIKIFMVADTSERAKRRHKDLAEAGIAVSADQLEKEIAERDRTDSERSVSPLKKASDAIILDTTHLAVEEQVDFIVRKAKEKMK